jgi:hypothetical protein
MQTINRSRKLLTATMLSCVLVLSACMDESCNFTGPSETAGSHGDDDAVSISMLLDYAVTGFSENPVIPTVPPETVSVRAGQSGPVVVPMNSADVELTVDNVKKDVGIPIFVDGVVRGACVWAGTKKLFAPELRAQVQFDKTLLHWTVVCS